MKFVIALLLVGCAVSIFAGKPAGQFTILVQERSKQGENQFRQLVAAHAQGLETFANNIEVIKEAAREGLNQALEILDSSQSMARVMEKSFVTISNDALDSVVAGIDTARINIMKLFFGEVVDYKKLFNGELN